MDRSVVFFFAAALCSCAGVAADSPATSAAENAIKIENGTFIPNIVHEDTESVTELTNELSTELVLLEGNSTDSNSTLHDHINLSLGDDEERVLSGGEVKVRKKRTFCKRCYPTYSYGYGGGGGCCGQCGQCGGGYQRPIKVIKVVVKPSFGYGGGGGRCCRNTCNVCGR